jgi:hypothetical protein
VQKNTKTAKGGYCAVFLIYGRFFYYSFIWLQYTYIMNVITEMEVSTMNSKSPSRTTQSSNAIMCTLKELPSELRLKAAAKAIEINPENAPKAHRIELLSEQEQSNQIKLALLTSKYWYRSGVNLTVGFIGNPPADLQARIISHMNAWDVTGNVHFTASSTNPQVRISFENSGYWSYLGTDILLIPPDRATMNLQGFSMNTPESEYRRVVRHETGHTLGFPHEHTRAEIVSLIDEAKAIAYFGAPPNNWSPEKTRGQVLTPLDPNTVSETMAADPNSIMCYKLPASIMTNSIAIAGGRDIDASDMEFVAFKYPKAVGNGRLMHTLRNSDGSWQPLEDLTLKFGVEGGFISVAGANGGGGDTQFAFVTNEGYLWHSIRFADGSWGSAVNLSRQLNITNGVAAVSGASGANGTTQFIVTTSDGQLLHTVRESTGTWQPLGDLKYVDRVPGNVVALGGTNGSNGTTQFVFTTNDGHLWHTIRHADGTWQQLGNLSGALGYSGVVTTIAGAKGLNGETQFVFATNSARLWHTRRYENGDWTRVDDLGKELGVQKRVIAVGGCSGAGGQTQFVFTTEDGQAWHTIRYADGGWQRAVPLDWVLPIDGSLPALAGVTGDNGAMHFIFPTYH